MYARPTRTLVPLAALLILACNGDPFFPDPNIVVVQARVTGGIAGIDYTVSVDGGSGIVTGVQCVNGCWFQDGEQILRLPEPQLIELLDVVFATGIRSGSRDYGDGGCCDQIGSSLTWTEPGLEHTITGSSTTLPDEVQRAVNAVAGFASGTQPVVVDFGTTPEAWPLDPLNVLQPELDGDLLTVTLEHSGGCETHAYGLVAWNGWLESNPVQVEATLVHEDYDDSCDAALSVEHTFTLQRLRSAYQEVYGFGPDTLLITVTEPGQPASEAVQLEYAF